MFDNDGACNPTIELRADKRPSESAAGCNEVGLSRAVEGAAPQGHGCIAVIETRVFFRECLRHSMRSAFSLPIVACSTVSELEHQLGNASPQLIFLSLIEGSNEEGANSCKVLSELLPKTPLIVLADWDDAALARAFINHGAKGYIATTLGFEIAVAVARFVLAGGTYVPPDNFLEGRIHPGSCPPPRNPGEPTLSP